MIPVVIAGIAGFFLAGRSQPRTRCEKKTLLGPRTGRSYDVEEFPDAGFLILRMASGEGSAHGVFQHVAAKAPGDPRFSWRGGKGPSESLHGMCLDLGIVKEQPANSKQQTADSSGSASRKPGSPEPSEARGWKPQAESSPPSRPVAVPSPAKKTA